MSTGTETKRNVVTQVCERDVRCRMTGVASANSEYTDEEIIMQIEDSEEAQAFLEVTHGIPFSTGATTFNLVYMLTGISVENWVADSVQNALLLQQGLHSLFAAFQLYLEWSSDDSEIFIRRRRTPPLANPIAVLRTVVNDAGWTCAVPGMFRAQGAFKK
ncbi:hypothetical protein BT96DRAFT_604853 [Gymnopus androsaceus JB14]|uniref:HNH nuclease domain-containing protein n=1 Tax=Gymnopus androsaceus JB14 TaxID=1447944 RepID=A0A6A4HUE9_9AGAR|nr:hypothetical protein BT96DRAFT_604853 [Gymnopus androsaceus JB14]